MAVRSGKGSLNGNKHPYLRLEKYLSGELAFWRRPNPETPSIGYNKQMYEDILAEAVKGDRRTYNRDGNIGIKSNQA